MTEHASANHPTTVGGLVITLQGDAELRQQTFDAIAAHDALTIGEQHGEWLSAALESPAPKQVHRWLDSLSGVAHVDVVFASVDDAAAAPDSIDSSPSFVSSTS